MGCTPSIHVSQTGVIYCRDSDESPTGMPGQYRVGVDSSVTGEHGVSHLQQLKSADVRMDGTATSGDAAEKGKPGWTDAGRGGNNVGSRWLPPQIENNRVQIGSFQLAYNPLKILLVFAKEDAQSDVFWSAAQKLQYKSDMVSNPDSALACYQEKFHDIVIVDGRNSKPFEAEAVSRSLRAVNGNEFTTIIVIVKKSAIDKEDMSVQPYLNAGFNRCFVECPSLGVCLNELIQLEINEFRTKLKLKATQALLTALAHCRDIVEITNENGEIQYVNSTGERLFGYTSSDVLGKNIQDIHKLDNTKAQFWDSIQSQLQAGKEWEGTYLSRRKSGDSIALPCKIFPVVNSGNKATHHVYIKEIGPNRDRALMELANGKENAHISTDLLSRGSIRSIRKGSYDVKSLNEVSLMNRRQSMARIMTIEAPITKVINLISSTQENCPAYIAQALDKVLDILRSTELYSPQLLNQQSHSDDPITIDLLGGLLQQGPKVPLNARRQSEITFSKGPKLQPSLSLPSLSIIPSNIKKLLENETKWSFDVLQLERLTNKRPLVWLGMVIFARFGVASVLNCDETTIQNWLTLIEANYHTQNPYHNSTHAADVLQATAYFLDRDHVKVLFDQYDKAACLIAAAVHDVDHPGKNSAFLCNSNNELAILYNDLSVLESHHSAIAFKLTQSDKRVNIFKNMDRDDYRDLRKNIIDMVLATEMTKHFEHLSKFVNSFTKPALCEESSSSTEVLDPPDKTLVKRMLIKCADVSNPARELEYCIEWAHRIATEYFQQTEEEKTKGLPIVMPMFDRATCSIPKSQTGFMDIFINDMFESWDAFADLPELMENLHKNYQYWKEQEQRRSTSQEMPRLEEREGSKDEENKADDGGTCV